MITLTSRQRDILLALCNIRAVQSVQSLASFCKVSTRSIRNDLEILSRYGAENGFEIRSSREKGLEIVCLSTTKQEVLEKVSHFDSRILDRSERVILMAYVCLLCKSTTYQELSEIVGVSRQTAYKEFRDIERLLEKFDLFIRKTVGKGLFVEGNERDVRSCFISLMNTTENSTLLERLLDYLSRPLDVDQAKRIVSEVEQQLAVTFSNKELLEYGIAFSIYRAEQGYFVSENKSLEFSNDLLRTQIKKAVGKNLVNQNELHKDELDYIYLLFLSLQSIRPQQFSVVDGVITADEDRYIHDDAYDIVHKLLDKIGKPSHTLDKNTRTVAHFLMKHLRAAIMRSRSNIAVNDQMTNQVKITIPLVFEFTKKCLEEIQGHYNLSFTDEEIAFIALYLESILESAEDNLCKISVLFVCSFGLAASSVLKTRMTKILPEELFVGPLSVEEAYRYLDTHKVDLIISTIDFQVDDIPVVLVSPLVSSEDTEAVQNQLYQLTFIHMCKRIIQTYQYNGNEPRRICSVAELVSEDCIAFFDDNISWENAILEASKPLVKKNYLTQSYVKRMINAVREFGTYMVLTPEVAYVHAGTDDGIIEECSSILVLKQPILFGNFNVKRVRIICVLGIKNREKTSLLSLASIFERKENLSLLQSADFSQKQLLEMHD